MSGHARIPAQRDGLIFREARSADIPVIRAIRSAVRENTLSDPERIPASMVEDYLTTLGKGWVCQCDDRIVGFSFAATRSNSIWALFVLPAYEGRGVGKELLKLATGWLFDNGAERVMLSTSPDTRADRFYQTQGWSRGQLLPSGEVMFSRGREA